MITRLFVFAFSLTVVASCSDFHTPTVDSETTPISTIGEGKYGYGATIDGVMTWWDVPFEAVRKTPSWSPGEELPLSVSKAVELASVDMRRYTDTPDAYRLDKVEWMHIGNHMEDEKKWIYLVTFEREWRHRGREFQSRGTITIPVLLDGTVVQGKREARPPH